MKYSCELVRDLLPLYHDEVCSDSSKRIVEEHLLECDSCRSELKKYENNPLDSRLRAERADVVGHHTRAVKRKSLIAGICFAGVLAIPILVCLIVNIATGHALDWFFIVLTSLMVLGSVTVVPLVVEKERFLWGLGSFTGSLLLLLFSACLYYHGDWFFVVSISVVFGLSVVFLPIVVYRLPFGSLASRHKGLIVMVVDTLLLYATVIVAGAYSHFADFGQPLLLTTVNALFPWILFAVIRYLKANGWIRAGICVIISAAFFTLCNDFIMLINDGVWRNMLSETNLHVWNEVTINANIYLLALMLGGVIGAGLIAIGIAKRSIELRSKDKA